MKSCPQESMVFFRTPKDSADFRSQATSDKGHERNWVVGRRCASFVCGWSRSHQCSQQILSGRSISLPAIAGFCHHRHQSRAQSDHPGGSFCPNRRYVGGLWQNAHREIQYSLHWILWQCRGSGISGIHDDWAVSRAVRIRFSNAQWWPRATRNGSGLGWGSSSTASLEHLCH